MLSPDAVGAVAALFILGMVWLRTRMHYQRAARRERARGLLSARPAARLTVTRAGWGYFAALMALFVVGWFAAPLLARRLAAAVAVPPVLARVIWFLLIYYLFILVHRALRTRGAAVFKSTVGDIQEPE